MYLRLQVELDERLFVSQRVFSDEVSLFVIYEDLKFFIGCKILCLIFYF